MVKCIFTKEKTEMGMFDYAQYKSLTEKADWRGICEINGVHFDSFGTDKEFDALPKYIESGEVVFAFASGVMKQTQTSNFSDIGVNTWLVILTSERFLFMDAALLTSSIDTQSVRLDKVQAISASQGFLLGKISIDLGSRLIVVDNCEKDAVKVIRKGDALIANCIGRGLSLGTYSADKCSVKGIYKKEQLRK